MFILFQHIFSQFSNPPQTREGIYGEYQVEVKPQAVDDAKSTFKTAKDTKKGQKKYVAVNHCVRVCWYAKMEKGKKDNLHPNLIRCLAFCLSGRSSSRCCNTSGMFGKSRGQGGEIHWGVE